MAPPESTATHTATAPRASRNGQSPPASADTETTSKPKGPVTGLFGIRWAKVPGEIDSLNSSVERITAKFVEENKKFGTEIPPEVAQIMKTGGSVYKKRWTWLPLTIGLVCTSYLSYRAIFESTLEVAATFVLSFVWYDLFSGILHVLLDNPLLMALPIMDEPCLEFQWHHHVPHDLTSKSFLEVCGDLNVVICILVWGYLAPFKPMGIPVGFGYDSPLALTFVSWKLLLAYFGQLCHSMSHMPAHRRPNWVGKLQSWGIMLHPKAHAIHHKSYDDNFCVGSGLWNGVVTKALSATNSMHKAMGGNEDTNAYTWLVVFTISLFVDIPLFISGFNMAKEALGLA